MAYLTEKMANLEKKLKKTMKHGKKHACGLSDSDSNSYQDSWSGSTGSQVDKHLKLEQPMGIDLNSTDTRPINSLTAKSVPAGTKLILFGRYILNIYVGIVRYFLRTLKLSAPKSTYRHNAQIGEYRTILTSAKKKQF